MAKIKEGAARAKAAVATARKNDAEKAAASPTGKVSARPARNPIDRKVARDAVKAHLPGILKSMGDVFVVGQSYDASASAWSEAAGDRDRHSFYILSAFKYGAAEIQNLSLILPDKSKAKTQQEAVRVVLAQATGADVPRGDLRISRAVNMMTRAARRFLKSDAGKLLKYPESSTGRFPNVDAMTSDGTPADAALSKANTIEFRFGSDAPGRERARATITAGKLSVAGKAAPITPAVLGVILRALTADVVGALAEMVDAGAQDTARQAIG